MAIEVTCPQCGKRYQVPESRAGQRGRCSCGAEVVVPQRQPVPGPDVVPLRQPDPDVVPLRQPAPPAEPRCVSCGAAVYPGEQYCPRCAARQRVPSGYPGAVIEKTRERPVGITILAILTWIGSGLGVVGGVIILVGGAFMGAGARSHAGMSANPAAVGAMAGLLVGMAVVILATSIFSGVVGYYLWNGANWARIVFIVMQSVGVLMGLANLAVRATSRMPAGFGATPGAAAGAAAGVAVILVSLCINAVFLAILLSRPAREFCAP